MLPKLEDLSRWAVIACDQFTSQPEYWDKVRDCAGTSPSAYNLILPEALLGEAGHDQTERINLHMRHYLEENIFTEYHDAYIYVERTLLDGTIRRGVVGVIDLNEYDYREGSTSHIRATELTVKERIPARKAIRQHAELELSHVILLCDDERYNLIEPLTHSKHSMRLLYDFELMLGGGHIRGWLVSGGHMRAFDTRLNSYIKRKAKEHSLTFAVGDGNHSLAAAKACYEEEPSELSRYALVELENLHDDALRFEPIHRLVKNADVNELLGGLQGKASGSWPVRYYSQGRNGTIYLDKSKGASPLIILQRYLDEHHYELDYIHDLDALKELANHDGCIGFELPAFDENAKQDFFRVISENGTMPRKTFSMGHAQEKRYYLEARRIR